jgi:UDP-N-acetylmuramoylalanine-D-glutamate ligase
MPGVPLKETVLVPCVVPKFAPLIVTDVPAGPAAGKIVLILGGMEKGAPLLVCPLALTTMSPAVAVGGTGTTIAVELHRLGVPGTPLKVMVLVP